MSDVLYRVTRSIGGFIFWMNSRPIVRGLSHVPATGPYILVATHQSPYDVPLLIRHIPRLLDFVSSAEVFQNRIVATIYRLLNAFPLDRSRADPATVRTIISRLRGGRVVAMFPEGAVHAGKSSVVHTRRVKSGVGRIARLSGAPVLPCVIIDSAVYSQPRRWFPSKRTRYGLIVGPPISPSHQAADIELMLVDAFVSLHGDLVEAMVCCPTGEDRHQQEDGANPGGHGTKSRDDAE
jgi:1-acyl-sn-glycerol-3-phosphate acyltransferase